MTKRLKAVRRRSSASLLASGFGTISLDQRLRVRRIATDGEALGGDADQIESDAGRAIARLSGYLESA